MCCTAKMPPGVELLFSDADKPRAGLKAIHMALHTVVRAAVPLTPARTLLEQGSLSDRLDTIDAFVELVLRGCVAGHDVILCGHDSNADMGVAAHLRARSFVLERITAEIPPSVAPTSPDGLCHMCMLCTCTKWPPAHA